MTKSSDSKLLHEWQYGNRRSKTSALKRIYEQYYPVVKSYVLNNSGSEEDAADIFQDALLVVFEKLRSGKLDLSASLKTFIYAIGKNLWLKRLASKKRTNKPPPSQDTFVTQNDFDFLEVSDPMQVMLEKMNALDDTCKNLLYKFYYDRMKMKDIALAFNLKNEQVAKNKKSKCMKKLRSLLSLDDN